MSTEQHQRPSERLMALLGKPAPPEPTAEERRSFEQWLDDGDAQAAKVYGTSAAVITLP